MRLYCSSADKALDIDDNADKLGEGGEGRVFRVPSHKDLVAKVFHDPQPRQAKIEAMLSNPPASTTPSGHVLIAWPVAALQDATRSKFAGFLMKKIEKARPLGEIAHPDTRIKELPDFTFEHLLIVGSNVTRAFAALHGKGYVVGDVNDENVLVNHKGHATLVDADSFQVPKGPGQGFYRCRVNRAEYTAPELNGARDVDLKEEHDHFGLGMLLFKLLMQGWGPFGGAALGSKASLSVSTAAGPRYGSGMLFRQTWNRLKHPPAAPPLSVLSQELQELARRCFEEGMQKPAAQPSASEWTGALDRAAKALTTCSNNALHRFGSHLQECVWCRHEKRVGVDLFPPLQKALPPAPASANTPAASTSAAKTPSNGVGFWDVLGAVAKALLTPAPVSPGAAGPALLAQPQADIRPGWWAFQMLTPLHPLAPGPLLVGGQVHLGPAGGFQGRGDLFLMGQVQPCQVAGQWSYDPRTRALWMRSTVNGAPPGFEVLFRLTGGGNGRYRATTQNGVQFAIQRVG
jgi:serine/threonine protein kinase